MSYYQFRNPTPDEASAIQVVMGVAQTDDMGGELMVFKNAILARAEVNKNRDMITAEGITELANTLPLMPLDDEHVERKVVGLFTAARDTGGVLDTDGFMFARRFPQETTDVIAGKKNLSIEAQIGIAECSVCGGKFERRKDYCAHLLDPITHGAVRILHGLKAVGGGITVTPAGTGTDFSRGSDKMRFVASEATPEGPTILKISASLAEPDEPEEHIDMNELEELKAQVQQYLAAVQAKDAEISGLQASVAKLTQERDQAVAGADSAVIARNRYVTLLKSGYKPDELDPIVDRLAGVDDSVVALLASHAVPIKQDSGQDDTQDAQGSSDEPKSRTQKQDVALGDAQDGAAVESQELTWDDVTLD
jgi:hypothetical protein